MGASQQGRPGRVPARCVPGHRAVRPPVGRRGRRARDALPAEPLRRLPIRRRRIELDRDHRGPAERVRLSRWSPTRATRTPPGSSRSTAPTRVASCPAGGGRLADARPRRVVDPRRRGPAAARRVPHGPARGDDPRHARSGRDHVRDEHRPALAQLRRRRFVADDHRHPARDLGGRVARPRRLTGVATVLLPRSLLALFPGVDRRHEVGGDSVRALIDALDLTVPGLRDRLVDSGPAPPAAHQRVRGRPAGRARDAGRPGRGRSRHPGGVRWGPAKLRPPVRILRRRNARLAARPQDRLERVE